MKSILAILFTGAMAAACSLSSQPAFNIYAIESQKGERAYRVECHGLFETSQSCVRAATRVCGAHSVRVLERTQSLQMRSNAFNNPRVFTFECKP